MIHEGLTNEFLSLFGRVPDRRIILWFDEKRDFERLLPGFEAHLNGLAVPPFVFLRYEDTTSHGQLWIKHEIHWASRQLPATQHYACRYVVYLPFAPERLDGPEQEGGWSADLAVMVVFPVGAHAAFLSCVTKKLAFFVAGEVTWKAHPSR
jgi:hypothetical protein